MNYYKATIQYIGTNYCGFQWQKDIPTIQNELNLSLAKLLNGKVTTLGASRTDTGVHAIEQIVKITSEQKIECESFLSKWNAFLPGQIRCLSFDSCNGAFNPTVDSHMKEYKYLFTNKLHSSGEDQKFIANNPYRLDIELMRKCAKEIVGTHDFKNFCSVGSNVKSTVREISLCEISLINPHMILPKTDLFLLPPNLNQCFEFKIKGNGFLKQMVRHLMSALWQVGSGKISLEEFSQLLNGIQKEKRLWKAAPSYGLYLYRISFKN